MVPGFNTDFKYRGETYHVQTEDNGVANPVVVTLLYHKGAILASRRTPYNDLVGKPDFQQALMGLMKKQHKDLMKALLGGAYDKNGAAPGVAAGSGMNPAEAAAAVAEPPSKPAGSPLPAAQPQTAVPRVPPRAAPKCAPTAPAAAIHASARTAAPRAAAVTLDEAIRTYLKEFATAAAAH